jgi:hypothetical protein
MKIHETIAAILLAAVLPFAGCQEVERPSIAEDHTLSAVIEQEESTRTTLDENNNILWSADDRIVAFMKSSYGHEYQAKPSSAGKSYADFSMVSSAGGNDLSAGNEWEHNVAYYPYSAEIECLKHGDHYALDIVLPSEQAYVPGSFGNGSMPMAAVSETNNITFKNICGGIKLQLKGRHAVRSIRIEGNDNEKLAGAATVYAYADGSAPTIELSRDASTSATLTCTEAVQLNESEATEFIIVLPPTEFSLGFTATVTDTDDRTYDIETDKSNAVLRSRLLVMPEVSIGTSDQDESQTLNPPIKHKTIDEPIKILCFGSSWFLNSWWYLNKITKGLGINAQIHGYYIGHSQFDEWISLYNNDLSPFAGSESTRSTYRYISENGENYTATKRTTEGECNDQKYRDLWYDDLVSGDWDIIAFQQGAHQSAKWEYWENCEELVSIIKKHRNPDTIIAFNSTWTPAITSSYLSKDTDGECPKNLEGQKLWQTYNWNNCLKMMELTGIDMIAPNGAMMYTLRRDPAINVDGDDLAYDGLHPNHGLPMFALACVLYETMIAPFYGISVTGNTWLPSSSDKRGPFNNSVFRSISEKQRDLIYEYVSLSLNHRFEFNEPAGWTDIQGVEILNTMPQDNGYARSNSGLVTEYSGYDWSRYDIKVTCRYGTNNAMYAGCFWGENDEYLGGFWKSDGTAKIFNEVILKDEDLPEGVAWTDVKKISLASTTLSSAGLRYSQLSIREK